MFRQDRQDRQAGLRACTGVLSGFMLAVAVLGAWHDPAGAIRIRDELNAFNGYTLGAPLANYSGLQLVKKWDTDFVLEVGLYENPRETVVLNGVAMTGVRYRFADRRLESIQLRYEGRASREKLREWLEERYGKLAPAERRMLNQVEWHGDQMTITLNYNVSMQYGTLWFISPPLHHLVNKTLNDMTE